MIKYLNKAHLYVVLWYCSTVLELPNYFISWKKVYVDIQSNCQIPHAPNKPSSSEIFLLMLRCLLVNARKDGNMDKWNAFSSI